MTKTEKIELTVEQQVFRELFKLNELQKAHEHAEKNKMTTMERANAIKGLTPADIKK